MRGFHFADLRLGVQAYGDVDPATGLPARKCGGWSLR